MAAGDIILSSGATITAAEIQQIAAEVKKQLADESKELADFEEVTSLSNVSSLPGIQQSGTAMKLVRVALSVLKGVDGKSVELTASQTAIQWRYVGESVWNTLVDLFLLKGDKGDEGAKVQLRKGTSGIEWKYEDDTAWQTLIPVADLAFTFDDLTTEQKDSLTRKPILSTVAVSGSTESPAGIFVHTGDDEEGNPEYGLVLSLPKGDKGEPPTLEMGTVSTGEPGTEAAVTLTPNGTTSAGSPRYKLNITIPRGDPGMDGTGTGNVLVDSYSSLEAGKQYSFQPSADGTPRGEFVETQAAVDIYPYLWEYWGEDTKEFTFPSDSFDALWKLLEEGKTIVARIDGSSYSGVYPAFMRQNGTSISNLIVNVTLEVGLNNSTYLEFFLSKDSTSYRYLGRYVSNNLAGEYGLIDNYDDTKPSSYSDLKNTDTINVALGKLEAGVEGLMNEERLNVTNAGDLYKDYLYSFRPSAKGSLKGTFQPIPRASATADGLMSSADKEKLDGISFLRLPAGLRDLTAESTDEQVFDALVAILTESEISTIPTYPDGKLEVGLYALFMFAEIQNGLGAYTVAPQWTLDGNPVSASYDIQDAAEGGQYPAKGSATFTYVSGGKLRSVTLTATLDTSGETATYNFTAKVEESGDDTYWLPGNIFNLNENSKIEEIYEMFGGKEEYIKLWDVSAANKKFFIPYPSGNKELHINAIPASVRRITPFIYHLDIVAIVPDGNLELDYKIRALTILITLDGDNLHSNIHKNTIYPSGYSLSPSLYSLTSSSTTDEISTAVGGESGLKEIIQAVKDGNRLVIRGNSSGIEALIADITVKSVLYQEGENGDIILAFAFDIYAIMGYSMFYKTIQYTKSSNTFSCSSGETNMES